MLYALGAAAAVRTGVALNWVFYGLGQVVVTSIQLMAQYLNECYDIDYHLLTTGGVGFFVLLVLLALFGFVFVG